MQNNFAVKMLEWCIREMSGADLPIVPTTAPLTENEIIIGFNRHTMKFGAGQSRNYTPSSGSA